MTRSPTSSGVTADPAGTELLGYTGPAGRRRFLLHRPPGSSVERRPLLLLLHGGLQTAAEFMAATGMNEIADHHGFLVAYPQQSRKANQQRFWNWFLPEHQRAGSGEPAMLAGIVDQVVQDWNADASRVVVGGFSSGGAMAAILAATYPTQFAAVAVHSGLAYQAADDVLSGLQAMQDGGPHPRHGSEPVPLLVVHGDRDTTVSPVNARRVLESRVGGFDGATVSSRTVAAVGGRRSYTVETYADARGGRLAESWSVHGGGHAWFGGNGSSFADPAGPAVSEAIAEFLVATTALASQSSTDSAGRGSRR